MMASLLLKPTWGTVATLAAGALGSAISSGLRSRSSGGADRSVAMPSMKRRLPSRPRYGSRRKYLRRYVPRSPFSPWRRIVRTGATFDSSIAAATFTGAVSNFALSDVQTSDLTSAYRLFRIRKVVAYFVARIDAANSGVANNYCIRVTAACDPEGTTAPASSTAVSAYDNSRDAWLSSGTVFKYTFYPKVVNSVDNAGVATAAGSYDLNPWLQLNGTGIAIPHRQLVWGIATGSTTTVSISRYFEYHFDVKGMA